MPSLLQILQFAAEPSRLISCLFVPLPRKFFSARTTIRLTESSLCCPSGYTLRAPMGTYRFSFTANIQTQSRSPHVPNLYRGWRFCSTDTGPETLSESPFSLAEPPFLPAFFFAEKLVVLTPPPPPFERRNGRELRCRLWITIN